ncbi:hypothetical protein [Sorangium sp. So ce1099]|uniref:hypothetical protein n=1 Tax=Sorangium sp. So ce1099 TaxID=3133331 RepID=UPI003F5E77DE
MESSLRPLQSTLQEFALQVTFTLPEHPEPLHWSEHRPVSLHRKSRSSQLSSLQTTSHGNGPMHITSAPLH